MAVFVPPPVTRKADHTTGTWPVGTLIYDTTAHTLWAGDGSTSGGQYVTVAASDLPAFTNTTPGAVPSPAGAGNTYFLRADATWAVPAGGGGGVTSVGLSLPAEFTVTVSPITTSGSLTATWASETANYVFAAPNGSSGTPTFRALAPADLIAGSGGGSTNYLRADGTWAAPATGGASSLVIGSSPITGGTANRILYESSGPVLADSSQMTWDGHTLHVDNGATGGTITPSLNLTTNSYAGSATAIRMINPDASAGAGPSIDFYWWGASPTIGASICMEAVTLLSGDLVFKTAGGGAPTEKLRIKYDGTVAFTNNVTFASPLNNLNLLGTLTNFNSNSGPIFNMGFSAGYGYSMYADGVTNQLSFGPYASNPICGYQFVLNGQPFSIKNSIYTTNVFEIIGAASQSLPLQTFKQLSYSSDPQPTGVIDSNFHAGQNVNASYQGYLSLAAKDHNATREGIRIAADASQVLIGAFGATPIAKPTVTGSRGGNAALASLLTALANLGWITDSSS